MNEFNEIEEKIMKLNDIGAKFLNQKKYKEAEVHINQALEFANKYKINNDWIIFCLHLNKSALERGLRNYDNAQNHVEIAINIVEDRLLSINFEFFNALVDAKNNYASILLEQCKYESALEQFNYCLNIVNKQNIRIKSKANLYNNIAMYKENIHDYFDAIEYYKKSLSLYEKIKDENIQVDKAETLSNLGVVYKNTGDFVQAEKCFLNAAKTQTNPFHIASIYINLASLYREDRKYNKAMEYFKKGINIVEKYIEINESYKDKYAEYLTNYGNLLLEMHYFDEALTSLIKSITIIASYKKYSNSRYSERVASTSISIANCYMALSQNKKAQGYFNSALKYFANNNKVNLIEYTYKEVLIYSALGFINKNKNVQLAQNYFLKSFGLIKQIKESLSTNNRQFIHKYKKHLDDLLKELIAKMDLSPEKLLILIENMRNEEFFSFENCSDIENINVIKESKLLTIEFIGDRVLFIISNSYGNFPYLINNSNFLEYTTQIYNLIENIYENKDKNPQKQDKIYEYGKLLFNTLPVEVQALFNEPEEICLSVDRLLTNFPFELMVNQEDFVGKQYLLPRVNGVCDYIKNSVSPAICRLKNNKKVIVYNPKYNNYERLSNSNKEGEFIKNKFDNSVNLKKNNAKKDVVLKNINDDISLFHFAGHATFPDRLVVSFDEIIESSDFDIFNFKNLPLFFLNCCVVGQIKYNRGGQYIGLPTSLLKRNAGGVICNIFCVFDDDAQVFSNKFYDLICNDVNLKDIILKLRKDCNYLWQWCPYIYYGKHNLKFEI